MENPSHRVELSKLLASPGSEHKPLDLKQISGQVLRTGGASRSHLRPQGRAVSKQQGPVPALESCLDRKKLVFSVGFELLWLPRDPGCALFRAPQKFATFF